MEVTSKIRGRPFVRGEMLCGVLANSASDVVADGES